MQSTHRKIAIALLTLAALAFMPAVALAQHYHQTNLVSDLPNLALHQDPDLVNSWGITRSSTSFWWVNDNGTGKSTLYTGNGIKQGLVVTVLRERPVLPPGTFSTLTAPRLILSSAPPASPVRRVSSSTPKTAPSPVGTRQWTPLMPS